MPEIKIRWSDNTAELTKHLKEGMNQIEATKASADKMVQSLSGDKLIAAAHKYVAAVQQMNGVDKLTVAEKQRINDLLTKAIEKYTALGKTAPDAMLSLANATKATSNSWQSFVTGFDVKSAISDPLGTAKNAVGALAGSFTPLGAAATVAGAALTAAGAAALTFVKNAAAAGAALDDLKDSTDISVPVLSRWSAAAKVMGGDITQLTNAVFKMQQGMGENSKKFAEGLALIGLSAKDFNRLEWDKRLELVATALSKVTDKATENAAGTAIFGKQYRDLSPVLRDFGQALELVSDIDVWTDEEAADAERFQMQLNLLKVEASELAISLGRELLPAANLFISALSDGIPFLTTWIGKLTGITPLLQTAGNAWNYAAAGVALFNKSTSDLPTVQGPATRHLEEMRVQVDKMGIAVPSMDDAMANWRKTNEQASETSRRAAQVLADQRRETERQQEAMERLDAQYKLLSKSTRDAIFFQRDMNAVMRTLAIETAPLLYAKALPMTQIALADVGQAAQVTINHTKSLGTHITELFKNIPKKLGEIQEDLAGKLTKLFGASADSVMGSIISGGLNFVFGPIGGLLAQYAAQGMAKLADLVWGGLKKIGGWFKSFFGFGGDKGPSQLTPEGLSEWADNYLASIGEGFAPPPEQMAEEPSFGATGGRVTPQGIQRFATGGFVRPVLQRSLYTRGADTVPIMASPGELILNRSQQDVIADVIKGAIGTPATGGNDAIVAEVRGLRADIASLQKQTVILMDGREVGRGLNRVLDNSGAVRTEMRESLGIA